MEGGRVGGRWYLKEIFLLRILLQDDEELGRVGLLRPDQIAEAFEDEDRRPEVGRVVFGHCVDADSHELLSLRLRPFNDRSMAHTTKPSNLAAFLRLMTG